MALVFNLVRRYPAAVGLGVAIAIAFVVRLAAMLVVPQPVVSDAVAYLAMAGSAAQGLPMRDNFGQAAFYSPGYPLALIMPFRILGSEAAVALLVNLVLALVSTALVHRIALRISGKPLAAFLAALAYAVWIPAVIGTGIVQKENLSTPLLLGFALLLLRLRDAPQSRKAAASAGLVYGAGLLAGASSMLLALPFLWVARRHLVRTGLVFAAAVVACLGPWLLHTNSIVGAPVLTTNSGFNLYLGNNPAATGSFVSVADTPAGADWEAMRKALGERGASAALGDQARAYILANPGQTIALGAKKLALFWMPNVPDAADFAADPKIAAARWVDVAQHVLIVLGALAAAVLFWKRSPGVPVVVAIVVAFWVIHAVTYIIVRYRDPAMPLLIVLAAMAVTHMIEHWRGRRGAV